MSITLKVEEYCQKECPHFNPIVTKIYITKEGKILIGSDVYSYGDYYNQPNFEGHVIYCEHREICKRLKDIMENKQLKQLTFEEMENF